MASREIERFAFWCDPVSGYRLEMVNLCQHPKVARTAAFKSKNNAQIVAQKKAA